MGNEFIQTEEEERACPKCQSFIATGVIFLYLFLFGVGSYVAFNHKKLYAQDFIEDLGGIKEVEMMTSDQISEKMERFFPQVRGEVEYVIRFMKYEDKIIDVKYYFVQVALGEWMDCENSLYKDPENFLMARVFLENQKSPVEVIYHERVYLFRK